MNKNSHGFAPILIVVILGLALVIGYLVLKPTLPSSELIPSTPSEESTANWKTYSDNEIVFKYPPNWIVGEKYLHGSSSETEFEFNFGKPLYLRVQANYNQVTGKPYTSVDEYTEFLGNERGNITLSNQPAIYRSIEGGEHTLAFEEVITLTPNSKFFVILYYQPSFLNERVPSNTFNQILATFRFLD